MASTQDDNGIVPVPADYVGAYYLTGSEDLYIIVQGVAYGGTTDIQIKRDPHFVGGLKYAVTGNLEHVSGFTPYQSEYVEKKIQIPSRVLPSKSIVFVDAENPLGRVIPIKFYGLG